jgi:hypothetical protein
MAKNNQQRREARRRATAQHELTQRDVIELIEVAARITSASRRAAIPRIAQLNRIGAAAATPHLDPAALVVDEVLSRLGAAWEHGWQPAELVHATRRRTSAAGARWMAEAVHVEAERAGAWDLAPPEWLAQLHDVSDRRGAHLTRDTLLPVAGRTDTDTWTAALTVLHLLHSLPRSHVVLPPPSRWSATVHAGQPRRSAPSSPHGAKMLTRIRALLAKAESTDFEAEADALTAKAQDLMTRHSIDEALLTAEAGESIDVSGAKVLIHHPYGLEKASLLTVLAEANRVRAVWSEFASCATIVGLSTDVAQVEMLFTSTLVQATRAMTHVGAVSDAGSRTSSFRKAFLSAYAVRIGERLVEASHQATESYGTDLVPVLRRETEAVDAEFERLFPHVTTGRRHTRFDARGWDAGTRAADAAVLPAGEVER